MDINKCKKGAEEKEKKRAVINIRITKTTKQWIKKNDLSPTAIFHEAIKDIKKEVDKK